MRLGGSGASRARRSIGGTRSIFLVHELNDHGRKFNVPVGGPSVVRSGQRNVERPELLRVVSDEFIETLSESYGITFARAHGKCRRSFDAKEAIFNAVHLAEQRVEVVLQCARLGEVISDPLLARGDLGFPRLHRFQLRLVILDQVVEPTPLFLRCRDPARGVF